MPATLVFRYSRSSCTPPRTRLTPSKYETNTRKRDSPSTVNRAASIPRRGAAFVVATVHRMSTVAQSARIGQYYHGRSKLRPYIVEELFGELPGQLDPLALRRE